MKSMLLTSLALLSGNAAAATAWHRLDTPDLATVLNHRAAVAMQRIRIDPEALRGAETLELPLPGGGTASMKLLARELRGGGDLWLLGSLDGETTAQVSLSLTGGYLAGLISAPEGNYEITTLADASQVVIALNQDAFPECATGLAERVNLPSPAAVAAPNVDPANKTDVLIVFSPQAQAALGGISPVRAFAQSAVDSANLTFRNSDMATRFRLAGLRVTTHDEAGDSSTDLSWLAKDAEVAAWRDETGADLVSLIVENMPDACGLGFVQSSPGAGFAPYAMQVTARGCAVGNLSWVHEHGHNMGMGHDPGNGNGAYAWSFGHIVDGSFRTVMAYASNCPSGCTRRPYFSNPAVNYTGVATGIVDQRDNHRTGNLTADIVANFRASDIIFLDSFQPAP
ncbi:MAG TPA: M12 family metallo-peptidase [Tahibacter sp.]|nr:M12 family metallo-peptidase [Tahibacter sp.]